MFTVLYEGNIVLFDTIEEAQEYVKNLVVAWTIMDPDNKIVFDWMDRVGP
jgi:hypothetical protein